MWLRAARASWWLGIPLVCLVWLVGPRETISHVFFELRHPVLSELDLGFRGTAVALALIIVVTIVSHLRRTRAVRTLSLLLPSYVAAYEACIHFSWFFRRHHYTMPTPTLVELRHEYHLAAIASLAAVAAPLLVAVVLCRWCRNGVSGGKVWPAVAAVPPLASIAILWLGFDQIIFPAVATGGVERRPPFRRC